MAKKKEHKDIKYKPFSMRLSDEVKNKLIENYILSKKSWNLFIKELNEK